jgi:CheY-like chemotaxis protein
MTCDGLTGNDLTMCRAMEAAQTAAEAATKAATAAAKLAEGKSWVDNLVSLAGALGSLILPVAAVWLLWRLWPVLVGIFEKRQFTVKIGGFELSAQAATDQFQAAIEDLQKKVAALEAVGSGHQRPVAEAATDTSSGGDPKRVIHRLRTPRNRRILWVDDHPANNAGLIAAFQADGIRVDTAPDGASALGMLGKDGDAYDAVLTDMGREEGGRYVAEAGLQLAAELQARAIPVPLALYSSARLATKAKATQAKDFELITSSPTEVRSFVLRYAGGDT